MNWSFTYTACDSKHKDICKYWLYMHIVDTPTCKQPCDSKQWL